MRPRLLRRRPGLLGAFVLLALVLGLGACSDDDSSSTTGPEAEALQPLSANFLPLAAGQWWTFVRREEGVFSPDTTLYYYNPRLPSGNTRWECSAGGAQGDFALLGRNTGRADLGSVLQHEVTVYLDAVSGGYDVVGEGAATDSSIVFTDGLPYAWLRFGALRWSEELANYSASRMAVDYEGDEVRQGAASTTRWASTTRAASTTAPASRATRPGTPRMWTTTPISTASPPCASWAR